MNRDERFTFLCNSDERRAITILAKQLQRTQSDAVRFVISNAINQLTHTDSTQSADSAKEKKREIYVSG